MRSCLKLVEHLPTYNIFRGLTFCVEMARIHKFMCNHVVVVLRPHMIHMSDVCGEENTFLQNRFADFSPMLQQHSKKSHYEKQEVT